MNGLQQDGLVALSRDEMSAATGGDCGDVVRAVGYAVGYLTHAYVNLNVVAWEGLFAFGSGSADFDWTTSK